MISVPPLRFLFVVAWLAFAALGLRGEEVEVATVRFANVRAPNESGSNWFEATVDLNVKPTPGPGRMVSRVRVSLLVACELPAASGKEERRREHYRAVAECVALEAGRTEVRFYLPPELVKRDRLHGEPKYWSVEIAIGGRAVSDARGNFSASLLSPESRKNFRIEGAVAAAANDGILQPQYLTPFDNAYPRLTPTFVRREMR